MKVNVEEVKSYKVTSEDGSISLGVFTERGEWNGMIDLRCHNLQQIIVNQQPFLFSGLFAGSEPKSYVADVVKASPSIISLLTPTPQPPDHPPKAGSPESPRPHC